MATALVTGGARGIGRAAAHALAKQGFKVWIGDREQPIGEKTAAGLRAEQLDVAFVQLDITDITSIRAAARTISAESTVLDALVNNAGISLECTNELGIMTLPSELPIETLRRVYEVNVFGTVAVTQIFLPLVRNSRAGRIVNVSSGLGSFGMNTSPNIGDFPYRSLNALAYKSSKAALNMVTVAFAMELRDTPIKINAASPTMVGTESARKFIGKTLSAQGGFATPEDGARILVQLATLPENGPSGVFCDFTAGELPW